MRMYIHGTDRGNAMLIVLIMIIIMSTILISLVSRTAAIKRFALEYKKEIILNIEQSNREFIVN